MQEIILNRIRNLLEIIRYREKWRYCSVILESNHRILSWPSVEQIGHECNLAAAFNVASIVNQASFSHRSSRWSVKNPRSKWWADSGKSYDFATSIVSSITTAPDENRTTHMLYSRIIIQFMHCCNFWYMYFFYLSCSGF